MSSHREPEWRSTARHGALLLGLWLGAHAALAGAQQVTWWTQDSGGGDASVGGNYRLAGTAGQADAGVLLAAGGFELRGGFWSGAGELASLIFEDGFETGNTSRWSIVVPPLFAAEPPIEPAGATLLLLPEPIASEGEDGDAFSAGADGRGEAEEIPTLGDAGALLLSLLLGACGARALRRRRESSPIAPSSSRRGFR